MISVGQRTRPSGEKDPKEWWKQTFHRDEGEKEEHGGEGEREREEEGKRTPPKKIDGLGDEAFWVASPVGGAMYVLKGDVYLRLSTGGREQFERAKRRQPPSKVLDVPQEGLKLLASLCRELQEMFGDQPIMLHQVSIAKLFTHVSQQTISNWIFALRTLGVLRPAEPPIARVRAARYHFIE